MTECWHVITDLKRLGRLAEGTLKEVAEMLRGGLIKQLEEMSIERFLKMCVYHKHKDLSDLDEYVPSRIAKQEYLSKFELPTKKPGDAAEEFFSGDKEFLDKFDID